jgi:hypothetical protein
MYRVQARPSAPKVHCGQGVRVPSNKKGSVPLGRVRIKKDAMGKTLLWALPFLLLHADSGGPCRRFLGLSSPPRKRRNGSELEWMQVCARSGMIGGHRCAQSWFRHGRNL